MINYPNINPVILHIIGPFAVRWYGLMYLIGLVSAYFLGNYRIKQAQTLRNFDSAKLSDLTLWLAIGLLIGGRLGHILFYQNEVLLHQPWELLMLWKGGMSFHGGLIGGIVALIGFCYKYHFDFFNLSDFVAPLIPLALFAGRIGNFINGELWGKVTNVPWAMIFPQAGPYPRHPTQLYEALLEGLLLFIILWVYTIRPRPKMAATGLFFVCYGVFRSIVEFYRVPDNNIGYLAFNWVTMGHLLSLPMIILGIYLLFLAYYKQ